MVDTFIGEAPKGSYLYDYGPQTTSRAEMLDVSRPYPSQRRMSDCCLRKTRVPNVKHGVDAVFYCCLRLFPARVSPPRGDGNSIKISKGTPWSEG